MPHSRPATLTAELHHRLDSLAADEWDSLYRDHPDPRELSWLTASSGMDGFSFHSIVVRQSGRAVLFLPLFQTRYVFGQLIDGTPGEILGELARYAPDLFAPKLLGVGFVEGEWGAAGIARDLDPATARAAWRKATSTLLQFARHNGLELLLLLNLTPATAADFPADFLKTFAAIDTYPCARLPIRFGTIDDYLAGLSKNTRKDLRRKSRDAGPIQITWTTDPSAEIDTIHRLYVDTVRRADLSMGTHRQEFFASVCQTVSGARYALYHLDGRLVAFNLLVRRDDTLVDKYFAMDEQTGRAHHLYFVSWLENIRHCLAEKITTYHAGPGAEATKARLGVTFLPSVTYFRHLNPIVHAILSNARPLLAYQPQINVAEFSDDAAISRPAKPIRPHAVAAAPLIPVGLDLDSSLAAQPQLRSRLAHFLPLPGGDAVRLWGARDDIDAVRRQLAAHRQTLPGPWLTFIGSGDFHHMTLLLLETLPAAIGPYTLLLVDNHPDWFRDRPIYHCGNWVARAIRLPQLYRAILAGQDSPDLRWNQTATAPFAQLCSGKVQLAPLRQESLAFPLRWPHGPNTALPATHRPWGTRLHFQSLRTKPLPQLIAELAGQQIYLSIDKDCLSTRDAKTDWEQGELSLDELLSAIAALKTHCTIIGADVCGEAAPRPLEGFVKHLDAGRLFKHPTHDSQADSINQKANMAILNALLSP